LVISHNGASGDYPDCTDLAYHSAIDDGADVIDCPVQVTSDGVLVCMSSVNLLDTTNVQTTPLATPLCLVPEIQSTPGIFTFNLTWASISSGALKREFFFFFSFSFQTTCICPFIYIYLQPRFLPR
jgi:glycerophosphoryl diester phosphodiesterase